MKRFSVYKYLCIAFVLFNVATAYNAVGTQPDGNLEPYSWWLVWIALVVSGLPAWLGYMAGRRA